MNTNLRYYSVAHTVFIAALVYLGFFVFCGSQILVYKRQSRIALWFESIQSLLKKKETSSLQLQREFFFMILKFSKMALYG